MGRTDLLNLFELRMALEPGQAALAARRATPEALTRMRTVLAAQRASVDVGARGQRKASPFIA